MPFIRRLLNRRFVYFTIILLIKGLLAWSVVFDEGPSWMTIVTEIPFFWVIFCLIEWLATKRKMLYYMVVNLLTTLLYFTVLMYYKYYGIIVTYHALRQADKVTKVGNSTYSLLDPYYLFIFVDIIVLTFILWRPKNISYQQAVSSRPLMKKRGIIALFVVSLMLCLLNIWPNRASMNENKQAEEMGILNYEVYTIFADTTADEDIVPMDQITQSEIDRLKGVEQPLQPKYYGADKGKNVIILQMESFQDFLIGLKIDGQEITPNMNKLAADNFHFNRFYTMVGQGTTSDAEYVVNTSLYVPKHEAATDQNVSKALPSLPKLMHANGYTTATFHTNAVEFWNRKELYSAIGWDKYYDQSFFGDDDHVAFGSSDEVLYEKVIPELTKMDESDQPFYAQVISMSSHHPFDIPESKYKMQLPERFEGTLVGNYIRAQNYADYALGQFIAGLKESGLWDDSVILFYGDHQGLSLYSLDRKEKELAAEMLGHEYSYPDMFKIGFVMHAPGVTYPKVVSEMGGQVDILPTVANLTGVSLDGQIHFGQDLLNQPSDMIPMRHFLPSGSVITNDYLFLPGIAYEDGTNYSLANGSISEQEGITNGQYNRTLKLLNLSDSYVKQLPDKDPADQPVAGSVK
ncbi:LTA synthase family protein [Paenibacillus sp. OV219]|uniref:LTA synthase family protein n=1 Tax=Paenibacillus sp. OV219 TaxID=1884377 RepID=UPI0008D333CA|nr:LTA synthase family protein [Paenibacillus sp. OV219]SEN53721.1 Phosphoglycerol transferase MdoB [Paenibacillus sp. OV219]